MEESMRLLLLLIAVLFVLFWNSNPYAGTIYSWADENGIKKFSNTVPENVEHFEVIEEMPLSDTGDTDIPADGGELMDIEREPVAENRITGIHVSQKPAETGPENNNMDERLNEKIQTEKIRLQGEIDRIEKLAVGRSLSLARKNAMIRQFQDKLNLLEKSPEKYFEAEDTE